MGGWRGVIMYCARRRKEWCQAGRLPIPVLMHSNAMSKYSALKMYYKSQISQQSLACETKCTFVRYQDSAPQSRVFKPLDLSWCEIVRVEVRAKKNNKSQKRVGRNIRKSRIGISKLQTFTPVCKVPTIANFCLECVS